MPSIRLSCARSSASCAFRSGFSWSQADSDGRDRHLGLLCSILGLKRTQAKKGKTMPSHLVTRLSFVFVTALAASPAFSQKTNLTWWEHSNPPHNNYSKEF